MKLTKEQITEKREELCKVLVAMNKWNWKLSFVGLGPTTTPKKHHGRVGAKFMGTHPADCSTPPSGARRSARPTTREHRPDGRA